MPNKFSKIYQNKIIGVGFFIKSQIPEVVKDAVRFQLLSNILSDSCLFGPHWLKNNRCSAASSLQGRHKIMQQGLWLRRQRKWQNNKHLKNQKFLNLNAALFNNLLFKKGGESKQNEGSSSLSIQVIKKLISNFYWQYYI